MRSRLVLFSVTLAVLACVAAASAKTRVALLGPAQGGPIQKLASLAEARLSESGEFQVVERQQIDRILTEQKLSLSDLVRGDNAVKIGQISGADLLAVLEGNDLAGPGLTVIDAKTGVRLWDASLMAAAHQAPGEAVFDAVRAADAKRQHLDTLRTVCLLAVRNADLPPAMNTFCDAVGLLTERELVGSASLALLDRTRLDLITRERALSPAPVGNDLLGSLRLVSLDISRRDGRLRADAMLSDAAGHDLGKVTAIALEADPSSLASALAQQLAGKLNAPATTPPDRAAEAARFAREAELRLDHSDPAHGVPPAEAAHALQPEDVLYRAVLARALIAYGTDLIVGPRLRPRSTTQPLVENSTAFPAVARGATLMSQAVAGCSRCDPAVASEALAQLEPARAPLRDSILLASHNQVARSGPAALSGPDLAVAKSAYRDYVLLKHGQLASRVSDARSFDAFSLSLYFTLEEAEWAYANGPEQWLEDVEQLTAQWVDVRAARFHGQYSMDAELALAQITWYWQWERHQSWSVFEPANRRICRWDLNDSQYSRLARVFHSLAQSDDPLLRDYAKLGELSLGVSRAAQPDSIRQLVSQFAVSIAQQIADPKRANAPDERRSLYRLVGAADMALDGTDFAGDVTHSAVEFMLSRHEIEPTLLWQALKGAPGSKLYPRTFGAASRGIDLLTQSVKVLDFPDHVVLSEWPDRTAQQLRTRLEEAQSQLAGKAVGTPTTRPTIAAAPLIDVFDSSPTEWVLRPLIDGDHVYALGLWHDHAVHPIRLDLLRFSLRGEKAATVSLLQSNLRLTRQLPENRAHHLVAESIGQACIAEGRYCAAVSRTGILVYPLDGSPGRVIDEGSGLPNENGQAVALMKNTVYAAVGIPGLSAYIVRFDLQTDRCEVIASSVRKGQLSPFDDNVTFRVGGIVADPDRNRLLLAVEGQDATEGLWEYRPASGEWKRLLVLRLARPASKTLSSFRQVMLGLPDNGQLPVITSRAAILFDLRSNRAAKLYEKHFPNVHTQLPEDLPRFEAISDAAEAQLETRPIQVGFDACVAAGWLWRGHGTASDWGRVRLSDGRADSFAPLRNNGLPSAMVYLAPTSDPNTLLAGDQFGLWVLTLPPDRK